MAKISKKRFLELAEEFGVTFADVDENEFINAIYTELNKPNNKWIPWNGGFCPVDPDIMVKVKFNDGTSTKDKARSLYWRYIDEDIHIIAYKIVKE